MLKNRCVHKYFLLKIYNNIAYLGRLTILLLIILWVLMVVEDSFMLKASFQRDSPHRKYINVYNY